MKKFMVLFFLLFIFINCSSPKKPAAEVLFNQGETWIMRDNKKIALEKGTTVYPKDILNTGYNSLIIIQFDDELGQAEIQQNASIEFKTFQKKRASLYAKKGNIWLKINKISAGNSFYLETPIVLAGVRGTKFFTFNIGDIQGICMCQGSIGFINKNNDFKTVHKQDYIVFNKNNKTIMLTPEELSKIGGTHNHSVIKDSPLGPKDNLSKAQFDKMMNLVHKKFEALQ